MIGKMPLSYWNVCTLTLFDNDGEPTEQHSFQCRLIDKCIMHGTHYANLQIDPGLPWSLIDPDNVLGLSDCITASLIFTINVQNKFDGDRLYPRPNRREVFVYVGTYVKEPNMTDKKLVYLCDARLSNARGVKLSTGINLPKDA